MRIKIEEDRLGNRTIAPVSRAMAKTLEGMGHGAEVFVQMRDDWERFCGLCGIGGRTREGLRRWGVAHVDVPAAGFLAFLGVDA